MPTSFRRLLFLLSSPVGPVAPSTESRYVSGPRHQRSIAVNHLGLITLHPVRKSQRHTGSQTSAKVAAASQAEHAPSIDDLGRYGVRLISAEFPYQDDANYPEPQRGQHGQHGEGVES